MSYGSEQTPVDSFFILSNVLVCYGWRWQQETMNAYIKRLDNKQVIGLINISKTMIGYIDNPTDEMERLHELRWML